MRPRADRTAVCCAVYAGLLAFLIQLVLVARFGVDLPYWDEWVDLRFWADLQRGTLSWGDVFAQHNEHRITVARLLFVALYWLFGEWNMVTHMACSALVQGLTVGMLSYALCRVGVAPLLCLVLVGVFTSPVQWDNILMGYQLQIFGMVCGVVLAAGAVAVDDRLRWRTVGLAVAGCLIASFSFGGGLCSWPAIGLALAARALFIAGSPRALWRTRPLLARLAAFALAALAGVALYFFEYTFPANRLSAPDAATNVAFALRLLAHPLLDESLRPAAIALAVAAWAAVAAALVGSWRRRQQAVERGRMVLAVGLVAFLVVEAALTGYSRGATPYVPSRYATNFMFVGVLWLVALTDLAARSRAWPRRALLTGLLAALLLVHADRWLAGLAIMGEQRPNRLAAREALAFYLRDHSPNLPFAGFPVFPPHVHAQGAFGRPEFIAVLPPELQPAFTDLGVRTSGDAWIAGGAYQPIAGEAPPAHWGTWQRSGPPGVGRIAIGPLPVRAPLLRIPLAGWINSANSVAIEYVGDATRRVVYDGPSPGDAWIDWVADVSAFSGGAVYIIGSDTLWKAPGWMAIGRPRPSSRALWRFDQALAASGWALLVLVLGGVAVALTWPRPFIDSLSRRG